MGHARYRLALGILGAALLLGACTVKKQAAPSLTGPSELSMAITIAVSPDVLAQDGASQSLVTITARDSNGQPFRNLSLRAEISVNGTITDFGTLSARNVVTDTNGRATLTYTAPAPAAVAVSSTDVEIRVTPTGSDFANETPRQATIRLVPSGFLPPPITSVTPLFTVNPPSPNDHEVALFDASTSKSTNGPIASYVWNFGDGGTASGITAQHAYNSSGTFIARLTVTDIIGATNFASQGVTVGVGLAPTASFLTSPASPNIGQQVNFNASASRPAAGRTITDYSWDFGDGTSGGGVTTTHAYAAAGTYSIILTVKDDAGRKGTTTQQITAGLAGPSATFTTSPASPIVSQQINFNASQSRPVPGRSIVSYAWDFGDASVGSGVQTTHAYAEVGTYTVTLTITDNAGQTAFATQSISVATDTPQARFTITPSAPTAPSGKVASVFFDGSTSTAAPGRTIVSYSWRASNGLTALGQPQNGESGDFLAPGVYQMSLTVTDDAGKTNTTTQVFVVSAT
jgi:PKD repeat protein